MKTLKNCWHWFWRQSRLNKIIILGLFAVIVPFCLPTVVSWFRPTIIKVGVAFYTYERASFSEGTTTTYFFEKRNLVTNCSLRRAEETQPTGQAPIANPQSWVILKLLLENASDQPLTQLRLGVRSPALSPATQLLTSPNVDATGHMDTPSRSTRPVYTISIAAIAPATSTVLSLKTPIDDHLRQFIYENHRTVTIQVPFVAADQFREYPPIVSRTNALKILNREGLLRTKDEKEADEVLTATLTPPAESGTQSKVTPYQVLPKSRACSEGEAGMW
ncbi:MAG: hypothetical protein HP491_03950 [Nitrospira sp.]|nr:hypothetical protein [Nitrospira sp.]MBH0182576.1 hypothetical protein [Nitrospira sp.]